MWSERLWTDFAINHRFIVFGSVALALAVSSSPLTTSGNRNPMVPMARQRVDQVEQGERSVGAITTCNPLRRLLTTVE